MGCSCMINDKWRCVRCDIERELTFREHILWRYCREIPVCTVNEDSILCMGEMEEVVTFENKIGAQTLLDDLKGLARKGQA